MIDLGVLLVNVGEIPPRTDMVLAVLPALVNGAGDVAEVGRIYTCIDCEYQTADVDQMMAHQACRKPGDDMAHRLQFFRKARRAALVVFQQRIYAAMRQRLEARARAVFVFRLAMLGVVGSAAVIAILLRLFFWPF